MLKKLVYVFLYLLCTLFLWGQEGVNSLLIFDVDREGVTGVDRDDRELFDGITKLFRVYLVSNNYKIYKKGDTYVLEPGAKYCLKINSQMREYKNHENHDFYFKIQVHAYDPAHNYVYHTPYITYKGYKRYWGDDTWNVYTSKSLDYWHMPFETQTITEEIEIPIHRDEPLGEEARGEDFIFSASIFLHEDCFWNDKSLGKVNFSPKTYKVDTAPPEMIFNISPPPAGTQGVPLKFNNNFWVLKEDPDYGPRYFTTNPQGVRAGAYDPESWMNGLIPSDDTASWGVYQEYGNTAPFPGEWLPIDSVGTGSPVPGDFHLFARGRDASGNEIQVKAPYTVDLSAPDTPETGYSCYLLGEEETAFTGGEFHRITGVRAIAPRLTGDNPPADNSVTPAREMAVGPGGYRFGHREGADVTGALLHLGTKHNADMIPEWNAGQFEDEVYYDFTSGRLGDLFPRKARSTLGFQAFDLLGNGIDDQANWQTMSVTIPPDLPGLIVKQNQAPYMENGELVYPVEVRVKKESLTFQEEYCFSSLEVYWALESDPLNLTALEMSTGSLASPGNVPVTGAWYEDQEDLVLISGIRVTTPALAHKALRFYPVVTHKMNPPGMELREIKESSYAEVTSLANLSAPFTVEARIPGAVNDRYYHMTEEGRVFAMDESRQEVLGEVNSISLGSGDQGVYLSLIQPDNYQDPEGDNLEFGLLSMSNINLAGGRYGVNDGEGFFDSVFSETVYTKIRVWDLSGGEVKGYRDSREPDEGFPFVFGTSGTTYPSVVLKDKDDPGRVLDDMNYTSNDLVRVEPLIPGTEKGGVLYIWNIDTSSLGEGSPGVMSMTEISRTMPEITTALDYPGEANLESHQLYKIESSDLTQPFTWKLTVENSRCFLGFRFDLNGSAPTFSHGFAVYNNAPATASFREDRYLFDEASGRVTIAWNTENGESFDLEFRDEEGTLLLSTSTTNTLYELDLSALNPPPGPDEGIDFVITPRGSNNMAGPALSGRVYTFPAGDFTGQTTGYEYGPEGFTYFFRWDISGSANAGYKVEWNGGSAVEAGEDLTEARFETTSPGGEYAVTLSLANGNSEETGQYFASRSITGLILPDFAPTDFSVLTPGPYGGGGMSFTWTESLDPEGCEVSYQVYWSEPGEDPISSGPLTVRSYTPDFDFTHNHVYEWYVLARDEDGRVTSTGVNQFTYDAGEPALTFRDYPGAGSYSSCEFLQGDVNASLSGITSLQYSLNGGAWQNLPEGEEFTLPLPEGPVLPAVKAVGGNGREKVLSGPSFVVDRTPPVLEYTREDFCGPGGLKVDLTAMDAFGGCRSIQYAYTTGEGMIPLEWTEVLLETQPGGGIVERELYLKGTGADGQRYYLALRGEDHCGNQSEILFDHEGVIFDFSPAEGCVLVSGTTSREGINWGTSPGALEEVEPEIEDPQSGIHGIHYAYGKADEEPGTWFGSFEEIPLPAPEAGSSYGVFVKVVNGAGMETIIRSAPISYDPTAPVITGVEGLKSVYLEGEQVRFSVNTVEEESPLTAYRLRIGRAENMTSVSEEINGTEDGALTGKGREFQFTVPRDLEEENAVFYLEARNAAGLVSEVYEVPVTLSREENVVMITPLYGYQSRTDSVTFFLEYGGSLEILGYEYRLLGEGADESWKSMTGTGRVEIKEENLNLVDGEVYVIEAKAVGSGGDVTPAAVSGEIKVDATAPMINLWSIPTGAHRDNLRVSWAVEDLQSPVKECRIFVEIGTDHEDRVYAGSVSLGNKSTGEILLYADDEGRPFGWKAGDRVYLTFQATNESDLTAERTGPPVLYDDTPPPEPVIRREREGIRSDQALSRGIRGFLEPGVEDPESGKTELTWNIAGGNGELLGEWQPLEGPGELDSSGLEECSWPPQNGRTYSFIVKSVNASGLESQGQSGPVLIDDTAPVISHACLSLGQSGESVSYVNDLSFLWINIQAEDNSGSISSDIESYTATPGSFNGEGEFEAAGPAITRSAPSFLLEDLPDLIEGKIYYFRVECRDNAGNLSEEGMTGGLILDSSTPEMGYVTGIAEEGNIRFDWSCETLYAPVSSYTLELLKDGVLTETFTAYEENTLFLEGPEEGTYLLRVRGINEGGSVSASRESEPILLDTTPPLIEVSVNTPYNQGFVYDAFSFDVATVDASMIKTYSYSIGTWDDLDRLTDGWITVTARGTAFHSLVSVDNLSGGIAGLQDESVIVLRVRARDQGGLWSEICPPETVQMDKTAPVITSLSIGNYYSNTPDGLRGISLEAGDNAGVIVAYGGALEKEESPGVLSGWVEKALEPVSYYADQNLDLRPFDLEHGNRVTLGMKVRDSVGHESEVVFTGPIVVDLEAPEIELISHNGHVWEGTNTIILEEPEFHFNYRVLEESGDYVEVKTRLFKDDDADLGAWNDSGEEPFNTAMREIGMEQNFSCLHNTGTSGDYTLSVLLKDIAGNRVERFFPAVHVNYKPEVTLIRKEATPGEPLTLEAEVTDPDNGEASLEYQWSIVDYWDDLSGYDLSVPNPEVRLYYPDITEQSRTYELRLVVMDRDGGVTERNGSLHLHNTTEGTVYANQYWSGVHELTGDVLIPGSVSVKVTAGSVVVVDGNPALTGVDENEESWAGAHFANQYGLSIEGVLELEEGSAIEGSPESGSYWEGVLVRDGGYLEMSGGQIEGAWRGVVIYPGGSAALENSMFLNNYIGLHLLKDGQLVEGCSILNNTYTGIKAESGVTPVLVDNVIGGSKINYYTPEKPGVSVEELNGLPGNSGNREE